MIAMACCEGVRRKSPTNYIFLGIFTCKNYFDLLKRRSECLQLISMALKATKAKNIFPY